MKKYYLFSNGTQALDWHEANCYRCKKYTDKPDKLESITCDIGRALLEAYYDDGSVTVEIARRMGYFDNKFSLVWMCPEVDWTEEWKEEYARRHPESDVE